jgi:hypothetical protein
MSDIKKIKELLESVTYEYENGDLSKEDYLELVKDINTSELVAKTAEEVEELSELNGLINNIVTGISLVA